jgi:hypothetical protein
MVAMLPSASPTWPVANSWPMVLIVLIAPVIVCSTGRTRVTSPSTLLQPVRLRPAQLMRSRAGSVEKLMAPLSSPLPVLTTPCRKSLPKCSTQDRPRNPHPPPLLGWGAVSPQVGSAQPPPPLDA